jgi:transposase-like protein
MGFLDRLFGRKGPEDAPAKAKAIEEAIAEVECPHAAVTPRWDSAADMGKTELVSAYVCESCGATFSREEGGRLTAGAAERLRVSEEGRQERMGH